MATNVPAPTLLPEAYGRPRHTVAEVSRRIGYDPASGRFWWKEKPAKNRAAGDPAGSVGDSGYLVITIDRKHYKAHQLAWALVTGIWPSQQVDHENCVRHDNRFVNLRLASNGQNRANSGVRRHNKSGFKGVQKDKNRWEARITVNKVLRRLGRFDTPEEANAAYMRAAVEAFGDFARAA